MRSSATAGLTPQQLLDRRRAQNKLAQRRFREKARMERSAGASSSASLLAAAAAMPTFPPHLDLSQSARSTTPRVRSSSSDSSSTSSSSASTSTSFSSIVSSPTSSCTELETPSVTKFKALPRAETTMISNMHVPTIFLADEVKPDLSAADTPVFMHPSSTFVPANFAILSAGSLMQSMPHAAPSSEAVTYSSLASSHSGNSIGLKMIGMHADPFLMSQPLPSPSILVGTSGSQKSATVAFPAQFAALPMYQDLQSLTVSSFENLLGLTPRRRKDDNPPESCLSPSSTSSSQSCVASGASWHFDRALTAFTQSAFNNLHRPAPPMSIPSQPFAQAIQSVATHLGLNRDDELLPTLISRLQFQSSSSDTNKGLVFDPTINWDNLPSNMLPTTEQLLYPHRAFIDACLPWPAVRSRLLKHAVTHPLCEEELALDLLLSVISDEQALTSFTVHGDDVLDPEAWELSQRLLNKWWGLFDDAIVKRTNWWRRQRGLNELTLPVVDETASESESNGLGTGSLDEAHRLAALLL